MRNWRVRSRLMLLVCVPTLTALVFGGARIASAVGSASTYQRAEDRAKLAYQITRLAERLETERDQTVYYIALGKSGRAGELSPAARTAKSGPQQQYRAIQAFYRQTDQAIAQIRPLLSRLRPDYSAAGQREVVSALTSLDSIAYLRQVSAKSMMPALQVVQMYADLIDTLIGLSDQTAQGTADPVLSQTIEVLGLVSRMKEEASQQRAILSAALLRGQLTPPEQAALDAAQASQASDQQAFNLAAAPAQREDWGNALSGSFVYLVASQEQQVETKQAREHTLTSVPLNAGAFFDSMTRGINDQMGSAERALATSVVTRAKSLRRSALTDAIVVGAALLLLLAVALTLTVLVGRSLVHPLRRLRVGTLEVAGLRLPAVVRRVSETGSADPPETEPIDVDSTDEIGDVARAFDQVHTEAIRLAATEAALRSNVNDMFVNLSRRSQALVERQIRLIDDLEQDETDAERLASLFQLDHLATRMRRNSENLLVLGGQEVTRRWTHAVAIVDVLRAAISEIEQYGRVILNVQSGISVRRYAVNDVVHLLSELVENATSFSPAESQVNVSGRLLSSGGVLLEITDHGVGMSDDEIATTNWRLDNPPVVDVAVSRRMGLFVVARLAARHSIRVRLRNAPTGGLTALVWLPDEVISYEGATQPAYTEVTPSRHLPLLESPLVEPPVLEPPVLEPPVLEPPVLEPPVLEPPVLEPPVLEPPVLEPPVLEPQVLVPEAGHGATSGNGLRIFEAVESDWFRHRAPAGGVPATAPAGNADGWSSPADEGWSAAETADEPVHGGQTAAGLPRRVPMANLVPGSAGRGTVSHPAATPSPARAKERLASFQRGVEKGRAAAPGRTAPTGEGWEQ
jgi:signal transduction histidine kinase